MTEIAKLSLWAAKQMLVPITPRARLKYRHMRRHRLTVRADQLKRRLAVMGLERRG